MTADEPTGGEHSAESVRDDIAAQILTVHQESYGAGASDVNVHLDEDLVVVVMDVELTPAERTLLEGDRGETVKRNREVFQGVIAPTFKAIVERATGRRVQSFLSAMSVEPLFAVELFRLEPRAQGARAMAPPLDIS